MTELARFSADDPIPGAIPIDFVEPNMSERTVRELKAIDDNIRAAQAAAPFIFLR